MHIKTGKDLIDSNIIEFEVNNGAWIGVVDTYEGKRVLLCEDYNKNIVNVIRLSNDSELNLYIKPLVYAEVENEPEQKEEYDILEFLEDVMGLKLFDYQKEIVKKYNDDFFKGRCKIVYGRGGKIYVFYEEKNSV